MKKLKVLALFVLMITNVSVFAQTPSSDIAWKATMDYFLVTDKVDTAFLYFGMPAVTDYISNASIREDQGSFSALLDEIDKDVSTFKVPVYKNMLMGFLIGKRMTNEEVKDIRSVTDTIMTGLQTMQVRKEHLGRLNDISFNKEYFYNTATHKIEVKITDALLAYKKEVEDTNRTSGDYATAYIKYSGRTTDSGGGEYLKIQRPEIMWAEGFPFNFIVLDSSNRAFFPMNSKKMDMLYKGKASKSMESIMPNNLKRVFDKRLVDLIYDAAIKGTLPAYAYNKDGSVGPRLVAAELDKMKYVEDDSLVDENGNPLPPMKYHFSDFSLTGLEVVEEITFNKKTYAFESKIVRVAVAKQEIPSAMYMPPGKVTNSVPMFWVKFQ